MNQPETASPLGVAIWLNKLLSLATSLRSHDSESFTRQLDYPPTGT